MRMLSPRACFSATDSEGGSSHRAAGRVVDDSSARRTEITSTASAHHHWGASDSSSTSDYGNGVGGPTDQSIENGDKISRRRALLSEYEDRRKRRVDVLNDWLQRAKSLEPASGVSQDSSLVCSLPPPCIESHPDDVFFNSCEDIGSLVDLEAIHQDL